MKGFKGFKGDLLCLARRETMGSTNIIMSKEKY